MKVKVLQPFSDKYTHKMHQKGAEIEVEEDRAKDLIQRGLAEGLKKAPEKEETEEPVEEPKKKATTKKKKD